MHRPPLGELEVAAGCPAVDVEALVGALDAGRARRAVPEQHRLAAAADKVGGSPHVFLSDGTACHNPGIDKHWQGEQGRGFPVVTTYDPSAYGDLLSQAARLPV